MGEVPMGLTWHSAEAAGRTAVEGTLSGRAEELVSARPKGSRQRGVLLGPGQEEVVVRTEAAMAGAASPVGGRGRAEQSCSQW
ncbi:unnamed protein product [Urochloa humidicola]